MHPPAIAPAAAQTARRGARSGSATTSGANTAPLGPGTTELCRNSHVVVANPAQPDSAQRCSNAITRPSIENPIPRLVRVSRPSREFGGVYDLCHSGQRQVTYKHVQVTYNIGAPSGRWLS